MSCYNISCGAHYLIMLFKKHLTDLQWAVISHIADSVKYENSHVWYFSGGTAAKCALCLKPISGLDSRYAVYNENSVTIDNRMHIKCFNNPEIQAHLAMFT